MDDMNIMIFFQKSCVKIVADKNEKQNYEQIMLINFYF